MRDRVQASPAQLGLALTCLAVGSLVTMPFVGRLCRRWGSARVTWVAAVLLAAAGVLPGVATTVPGLAASLAAFGAAMGALDVAMNVQANSVVRALGRPVMPFFHGAWSGTALLGAGLGAAAASRGVPVLAHLTVSALLVAVLALAARGALLPDAPTASTPVAPEPAAAEGAADGAAAGAAAGPRRGTTRAVAPLGAVLLAGALAEGAAADWGALLLRDERGSSEAAAALGYTAFAGSMAVVRLGGEVLLRRFGPVRVLRAGGLVSLCGVLLAVAVPAYAAGVLGLVLWGAGIACCFPVVMEAAGRLGGHGGGDAVAAVSTIGYAGFLAGPALVGLLAERLGLATGLLLVAAVLVVLPLRAHVVAPAPAVPTPAGRPGSPAPADP